MGLRAVLLLLAADSLASRNEVFGKAHLKLIDGRDSGSGKYLYYLVEHKPILGTCRWTHAFLVGEALLKIMGMQDVEEMRDVRKCGRSFSCTFYDASALASSSLAEVFLRKAPAGFDAFLIGDYWSPLEEGCPDWMLKDEETFLQIPFPGQPSDLRSWEGWLARQLKQFQLEDKLSSQSSLLERMPAAIPEVCTNSVTDIWESLWPDEFTAKAMLVIGCAGLNGEPTQPLLDKGAGGLFIDRNVKAVKLAKRTASAHNRQILNATVQPRDMGRLLSEHAEFVRDMEVLQVDVDTVDGPLVQAALDHAHPRAVVVEVRDVVPFPFRYSCQTQDTKGVPLGGANFAFWLHELQRRGYQLARLDHRDAVFVREEEAPPSAKRLLGTLGCYLLLYILAPEPAQFLREEDQLARFRWHWLESEPDHVIDEIWQNLTAWRSDVRFSLDV